MGWVIVVLFAIVVIYFATRGTEKRPASRPTKEAPPRPPNHPRTRATRPPTYTRERHPKPDSLERWNSEGREIPFAEPGLKGSLFHYGGTSIHGGVEHDGPYAVIDFETTGLSPRRDRVVEVAVARVDAGGQIEDEFATLVNPDGADVGPSFIHGITNAQVERAPSFAQVAPELLARMSGAVVVAHNATFEEAFLAAELERASIDVAKIPALCTLWLGRQTFSTPNYKLGTLARAGGVELVDKHAALGDVRAVSALLPQMTGKLRSPLLFSAFPLSWTAPNSADGGLPLVTRAVALRKGTDGWMHSLTARLPAAGLAPEDAIAEAYLDTLAEVLADGRLTREEAVVLADLAGSAGMGGTQVLALNRRFLDGLKAAALADDVLSAAEIRQLRAAAKALSLPDFYGDLTPTAGPSTVPSSAEPGAAVDQPVLQPADGVSANSMAARAERGKQALELQRRGSSRVEIASALGVGLDTVKSVLRDAKFYENPQSDPSRLALAVAARQARVTGVTRDRFQIDRGLSPGKSSEAWRDAATLADRL